MKLSNDLDEMLDDAKRRSQDENGTKAAEGRCMVALLEPLTDWLQDEFDRGSSDAAMTIAAMTAALSIFATTVATMCEGDPERIASTLHELAPIFKDRLDITVKAHTDLVNKN